MAEEEKSIDDLLRELGYADVADMAPDSSEEEKKRKKAKEKAKGAIEKGAKQGRGGLGIGTKKQLDLLEAEGY